MEIGPFKVTFDPSGWEKRHLPGGPEGIDAADTFFTNDSGSRIVFYLTGGSHSQMEEDIGKFSRTGSAALWQTILARDYVYSDDRRSLRVFSTLGPLFQVQYFFEADARTLLVAACLFGPGETVSAEQFDDVLTGFEFQRKQET